MFTPATVEDVSKRVRCIAVSSVCLAAGITRAMNKVTIGGPPGASAGYGL